MSIKRIPYSKRAIKTDKGWFTGWDQFGAPKFIDESRLAELAMPNIAKNTADKFIESKEYKFVKIVPAYFENGVSAVVWDGIEVIYESTPSEKISNAKKKVLDALNAPCFENQEVFTKTVYEWLRSKDDFASTEVLETLESWHDRFKIKKSGDDVEVRQLCKNYLSRILNNSRKIINRELKNLYMSVHELLTAVKKKNTYKTQAQFLLDNKSEISEYGKASVIRYVDSSGDVKTLMFTVGDEETDGFVYNTTISIPQIYICNGIVELRIPDSWKIQANKEKLRNNSSANYNE